jgi:hypothetical protein
MVVHAATWCSRLNYKLGSLLCISQRWACPPFVGELAFVSAGCGKKPCLAPFSFNSSLDDGGIVS